MFSPLIFQLSRFVLFIIDRKNASPTNKASKALSEILEVYTTRVSDLCANLFLQHKQERSEGITWMITPEEESKILSLLSDGADIESTGNGDGCRGTILYWAVWTRHEELVK